MSWNVVNHKIAGTILVSILEPNYETLSINFKTITMQFISNLKLKRCQLSWSLIPPPSAQLNIELIAKKN